jgi:hypothetical protein
MVRAAVEGGWPDPEQIRTDDDLTLLYRPDRRDVDPRGR